MSKAEIATIGLARSFDCMDLGIVTPTLNCIRTLRYTLESLRPLKDRGAKIIIADSFSTDGTLQLAKELADHVVEVPKGNMYEAINAGMRTLSTEWLTYINGDDLLYANAVMDAFSKIDRSVDVIYGNVDYIDWDGRFLHGFRSCDPDRIIDLAGALINPVCQQGAFFRKTVYSSLEGFDSRYFYAADFDFFLRAKLAGFKFYLHPHPSLAAFRVHGSQSGRLHNKAQLAETVDLVRRNGLHVRWLNRQKALARLRLRNFDCYLTRVLRTRQLFGKMRFRACMEVN